MRAQGAEEHHPQFDLQLRPEENYDVSELAEIVAAIVSSCQIEYASGGGPDKRCYCPDMDMIGHACRGFRPQWT